jgi:hypothetical protein
MSPEYVRPYVKAHKNDDGEAEAIAEAATRPTMRVGGGQERRAVGPPDAAPKPLTSGERASSAPFCWSAESLLRKARRKLEQRLAEMLADDEVLVTARACGS